MCFDFNRVLVYVCLPLGDGRVRSSPSAGAAGQDNLFGPLHWLLSPLWRQEVCCQGLQAVSSHPVLWFLHSGARPTRKTENRTTEGTGYKKAFLFFCLVLLSFMKSKITFTMHIMHFQQSKTSLRTNTIGQLKRKILSKYACFFMSFTFWLKGHLSRASLSPLITTKNKDRWLPRPVPSPFR